MELPDLSILDDEPIAPRKEPSKLRVCTVPVYASCGYDGVSLSDADANGKKDKRKLNLEVLFNTFKLDDEFVLITRKYPFPSFRTTSDEISDAKIKKYAKRKQEQIEKGSSAIPMFGNCVTFSYIPRDSNKNISVKIFGNYKLHITGCRNLTVIEELINNVILPKIRSCKQKQLVHYKDGTTEKREVSCLSTPDIEYIKNSIKSAMRNTQFTSGFIVDHNELRQVISEVNEEKPSFLPSGFHVSVIEINKYRGLPIVLENYSKTKKINIMIFNDCSHGINGDVNETDIKIGYDFINNLFEDYYERIVLRKKI